MNSLSNFIVKISNWKTTASFFMMMLFFNLYFLPKGFKSNLSETEQKLPLVDLVFGYNPEKVKEIIGMYSGEAKDAYIYNAGIIDGLYPFVYGLFMAILLSLVFYKWRISAWFALINLLPIFVIMFDYLENSSIILMLQTAPEGNIDTLAKYCSGFTSFKWFFSLVSIALLLAGLLANLFSKKRLN